MNSLQLKSKKLVAALLAAGVLGGAGVVAVEHAHTPARAQAVTAQVAPAANTAAPPSTPAASKAATSFLDLSCKEFISHSFR